MKFSLIHPSRSRPEKSEETMFKWWDRAMNRKEVQILVSCDLDDPKLQDYNDSYDGIVLMNHNRSAVDAINNAAKVAIGEIFIVVSDDTDCPMHWDKILSDAIGQSKDFVMKTDDRIQKRIITMMIMDRVYYSRDGRVF